MAFQGMAKWGEKKLQWPGLAILAWRKLLHKPNWNQKLSQSYMLSFGQYTGLACNLNR